jgi:predicted nucleotidyltransferase
MTAESILKTIKGLKDQIKLNYKAEIKGIFGSYVRNEQTSQSDIDILTEFQQDADLFDFVGLSQFLEERLNCKVDVVPIESLREELKSYVLREAVYI